MWHRYSTPTPRPRLYRAPSWSWAAILWNFHYVVYDRYDPELKLTSLNLVLKSPEAPFGAVTDGSITIRGWLRRLCMRQTAVDQYILLNEEEPWEIDGYTSVDCIPDAEEDCLEELTIWCLQVSPYDEDTGQGPSGAILTTEDGRVYRRRGLFSYRLVDKVDSSKRELRRCWVEKCSLKDIIVE